MRCEHEVRKAGWITRKKRLRKCGIWLLNPWDSHVIGGGGSYFWRIFRCRRGHETRTLVSR